MILELIYPRHPDYKICLDIYKEAFSKKERVSRWVFFFLMMRNKGEFYAIKSNLNSPVIGMTFICPTDKLTFIFYLAIAKAYQNQGYGHQVLDEIKKKYTNTIFLNAHKLESEIDQRRLDFYHDNSFINNEELMDKNDEYIPLSYPDKLKKDELTSFYKKLKSIKK